MVAGYKPKNSWAEHRALAGQNDYIDILGSEEIHPKHIMYHVPKYMKGVHKKDKHFQMQIKRRDMLENSPFPKAFPARWQGWNLRVSCKWRGWLLIKLILLRFKPITSGLTSMWTRTGGQTIRVSKKAQSRIHLSLNFSKFEFSVYPGLFYFR